MKKMKPVIIVFIMLVVLVLTAIVIRKVCTQNYIDQDIFQETNYILRYDRAIQKRGNPVKTIQKQLDYNTEVTVLLVYYEDMVIVYDFDEEKKRWVNLFGRKSKATNISSEKKRYALE